MKTHLFYRRVLGATLIEVLIVVSIVSILLNLALFDLKPFLAQNRLDNQIHLIKRAVAISRLNAQANNAYVTFCALHNNQCNYQFWHKKLTVFIDHGQIGVFDSNDTKIVQFEAINKLDMLTYNKRNALTFLPNGRPMGLNNGTFIYCPEYKEASLSGLAISVNIVGRVKVIDTDKCQQ